MTAENQDQTASSPTQPLWVLILAGVFVLALGGIIAALYPGRDTNR